MKAVLFLLAFAGISSGQYQNLWPREAPGESQRAAGTEVMNDRGDVTLVEVPQYQVYLPNKDQATGAAVVILPGGGYRTVSMQKEGHELAKWFSERGIAGIVVKYRVPNRFPVPFLDARRAVRTVRARASEWNVDPKKVGIMGFSAGGHLASMVATRFNDRFPEHENGDKIDAFSSRPDFAMLIYPVISMADLSHKGSKKHLLGDNPSPEQIEKYSTEKTVSADTPPVFIITTSDDGVDCRNSLRYAEACKANKVPVTLHLFEKGGHGYGLHGKGELSMWPVLMEGWLKTRGLIN